MKFTSVDVKTFVSREDLRLSSIRKDWVERLLFSSQSVSVRYLTCKFVQSLADDLDQRVLILSHLLHSLSFVSSEGLTTKSTSSSEYIQLIKGLLSNEPTLKYFFEHDQDYHLIERLCSLIDREIVLIVNKGEEEDQDEWDFSLGSGLKWLMECLSLCLEEDQFQVKWKSLLLSLLLNGYSSLKRCSVQRTKCLDQVQLKICELIEKMTRGNEEVTRELMVICLETIEKFPLDDLQSPLFLFERLCHFIFPQSANVSTNEQFFLFIENDANQEGFLQGRMTNNPYPSEDPSMGPLMRDVKKKICQDCELIALLEDENGMELLVANKIINLNLAVRDVYKKVWLPSLPPAPTAAPPASLEQQAMHVIYRMRGLLGDATEDIIERLDMNTNDTRQGKYEDEENPEEIYRLANVLGEHQGFEVMFKRCNSIVDLSSSVGQNLLAILLKLFEYAIQLASNRERLIDPQLRTIGSLFEQFTRCLQQLHLDHNERRDSTLLLSSTERCLSLLNRCFHHASERWSPPSIAFEQFSGLSPSSEEDREKIHSLFESLQFDRFDLEQTSEQEFHLTCFTDICQQHFEKKHSSISTKAFVDILNRQDGGVIDQAIHYIQLHSPPVKMYLGMHDQQSWKEFLLRPSLSYVLRLPTGLSSAAQPAIQAKIAQTLLPILHKIEQLTNSGKVGVLTEDLLQALTGNEEVARQIDQLRQQTRAEKKTSRSRSARKENERIEIEQRHLSPVRIFLVFVTESYCSSSDGSDGISSD